MSNLKEIEFVFENCEYFTIPGEYIGWLDISKIEESIRRIACNSVDYFETAKHIAVEIHSDANKLYDSFGIKRIFKFPRLCQYNDITTVSVTLEDDGKEETYNFFPNWVGDSDYENEAQKTVISEHGHLYLVIDKKVNKDGFFEKCFPLDAIECGFSNEPWVKVCKEKVEE